MTAGDRNTQSPMTWSFVGVSCGTQTAVAFVIGCFHSRSTSPTIAADGSAALREKPRRGPRVGAALGIRQRVYVVVDLRALPEQARRDEAARRHRRADHA